MNILVLYSNVKDKQSKINHLLKSDRNNIYKEKHQTVEVPSSGDTYHFVNTQNLKQHTCGRVFQGLLVYDWGLSGEDVMYAMSRMRPEVIYK